jgi:hypothetical protein
MRVGPYKRLGQDLHTTWGTYPSPYITQPASAVLRPWLPPTIRGRHQYRTQPRPLTVQPPDPVNHDGVAIDIANRGRASLVMPSGSPAHSVGAADPQRETKTGMYIFLGVIGLMSLGWLAFGAEPQKRRR